MLAPWLAMPAVTAVLVALSVEVVCSTGLDPVASAAVEGGVSVGRAAVSPVVVSRGIVVVVPVSTILVVFMTGEGPSVATAAE